MTDTVPHNDPTTRTIETLHREIKNVEAKAEAARTADCRLNDSKFKAIDEKNSLIENQRIEQKSDTKIGVDAALAAQEKAVKEQTTASERSIAKSEAATAEQLKQLSATIAQSIASVTSSVSDLKERVVTIESAKRGGDSSVVDRRAEIALATAQTSLQSSQRNVIISSILGAAGLLTAVISLLFAFAK